MSHALASHAGHDEAVRTPETGENRIFYLHAERSDDGDMMRGVGEK